MEANRVNNVATDICGFRLSEVSDPVSKVRDIIKFHIDPVPVFYLHLVEIGTDRAVLVVHIPDNQETPFITKDGHIYRRVGDSSEPVHENNRFAVDRLVDNGRGIAKRFEEFCVDDRAFSQAEENQAWVNVFISPYPLGSIERMDLLSGNGLERSARDWLSYPETNGPHKSSIQHPNGTNLFRWKSKVLHPLDALNRLAK